MVSSVLEGGPLCIGFNKMYFQLSDINQGCVPSSLTFSCLACSHILSGEKCGINFTPQWTIQKLLAWGRGVCKKECVSVHLCWDLICASVCMLDMYISKTLSNYPLLDYPAPNFYLMGSVRPSCPLPPLACSHWLILTLILMIFFLIYITNHSQWCIMRKKTCMVLLTWYFVHTSKTFGGDQLKAVCRSVEKGRKLSVTASYCISTLYFTGCDKISMYHIVRLWPWLWHLTLWDSGCLAIEGTVDYNLIWSSGWAFINWSRMLHDSPLILWCLKPLNKD